MRRSQLTAGQALESRKSDIELSLLLLLGFFLLTGFGEDDSVLIERDLIVLETLFLGFDPA